MKLSIYSKPPENISKQIRQKIREIAKIFGKNHSSAAPLPHITMRSSFEIPKNDFSEVCRILREELIKSKKPIINLNGWARIPPSHKLVYGFYLKVEKNKEITELHNRLEKLFKKYKITYQITDFEPHISLAWNMRYNMKKKDFERTSDYLKKQRFTFRKHYFLDKLFIYEQVAKNKFRFIKKIE